MQPYPIILTLQLCTMFYFKIQIKHITVHGYSTKQINKHFCQAESYGSSEHLT